MLIASYLNPPAVLAWFFLATPVLAQEGPATPGPVESPGPCSQYFPERSYTAVDLDVNPLGWEHWWRFNSAAFTKLKARERVFGFEYGGSPSWYMDEGEEEERKVWVRPGAKQIGTAVIPALLAALKTKTMPSFQENALVALAQMSGAEELSGSCEKEIRAHLESKSPSVSERAALALGILGSEHAASSLEAIAAGTRIGKRLVGRSQVPMRTRITATYGLGLIGAQTKDKALRVRLVDHFVELLRAEVLIDDSLKTATVIAMGLTPIDAASVLGSAKRPSASFDAQVTFLVDLLGSPRKRSKSKWSQSNARLHVPGAIAHLMSASATPAAEVRAVAIETLTRGLHSRSHYNNELKASCALALGQIVDCRGDDKVHKSAIEALKAISAKGDLQASYFAIMAIGQIAARPGPISSQQPIARRKSLVSHLRRQVEEGPALRASWASLSLGACAHQLASSDQDYFHLKNLAAIRKRAKKVREPEGLGAPLLALGLCHDLDSVQFILERIGASKMGPARGPGLIALGLMDHQLPRETLQSLMKHWPQLPEQVILVSEYMGMVGDWEAGQEMIQLMKSSRFLTAKTSLARGIGNIEDRNNLASLVSLITDTSQAQSTRDSAVLALGTACDQSTLPWLERLSTHINYHALDTFLWNPTPDTQYNTEPGLLNHP